MVFWRTGVVVFVCRYDTGRHKVCPYEENYIAV